MGEGKQGTYCWPVNLMKEILPLDEFTQWLKNPPENAAALLNYMIDTTLRTFECDILRKRYQEGQTLQVIGDAHQVTREWIRVTLQKSVKRLQNHQRRETLLNGLDWKIDKEKDRAYQAGFRRGYRHSAGLSIDAVHNAFTMEHYLSGLPGYLIDLPELGLCESTCRLLVRVGINSVEQLVHTSGNELQFKFRVNARAQHEIVSKLARAGLQLKDDENVDSLEGQDSVYEEQWVLPVVKSILSPNECEALDKKIPIDFYQTFHYVIQTHFTEEEGGAFLAYFRDQRSVDTISREMGLTRQNVTSCLGGALHKLESNRMKPMMLHGIKGYIKNQLRIESERGYFDGFDAGTDREMKAPANLDGDHGRKQLVLSIEKLPVEVLKLSMRARHCLMRAGIYTIGDLMQYTDKELLKIPYLGYGTLNEIRDKQREHYRNVRTDMELAQMDDLS